MFKRVFTIGKYVRDLNNVNNFENVLFLNNIEFQMKITMFKKCRNFETFVHDFIRTYL